MDLTWFCLPPWLGVDVSKDDKGNPKPESFKRPGKKGGGGLLTEDRNRTFTSSCRGGQLPR